jgi:hypothetical protein
MLRLVHPAKQGQEKRTSKGRRSDVFTPTPEERARIQAAVQNTARAYGGYDVLSEVLRVPATTLYHVKVKTSYAMAVLVARAAGIPVEQILSGKPHEVGACAVCGRKGAR